MEIKLYNQLLRWAQDLDYVFNITDFQIAFKDYSKPSVYRLIRELVQAGEVIKVKRGIYAFKEASLLVAASRIYPDSYLTAGTVLAKEALIGSIPQFKIQAVKIGTPRTFRCSLGSIEYFSISPKLFFGFEKKQNGFWATPEKAFLDVCYYTFKGHIFSFNPQTDVTTELLDQSLLNSYLSHYDQRFLSFYRRIWK